MNNTAPLVDIFEFVRNGKSVKQDKSTGGLPITRIETIADGTIDSSRVGYADLQEAGNERWLLQPGDILFSHINSVEQIGKCAIFEGHPQKLVHGMNLLALRPNKKFLDAHYAYRAISSPSFRASLQQFVNKAVNQASISTTNLKSLEIPLPSLDKQRRIAAILDKADALRRNRKRAIDLVDNLTQSMFAEMFGDPFAKESLLPRVAFEEVTTRITYGFTQPVSHHSEGIPILTAKNIRFGHIDFENVAYADRGEFVALTAKSKPSKFDILITKDGAIGRSACVLTDVDICINQSVALVKPRLDLVEPLYLLRYLLSAPVQARIESMKKGNAMPHLQITELAKFPVALPALDLQRRFVSLLNVMLKQSACQKLGLHENESLFSSLQSRAFSGQL